MKKFYKSFICKIGLVFTMALMFGMLGHTNVHAATVGQQLTTPESSWQRIDDTSSNIKYIGVNWNTTTNTSFYNGSYKVTNNMSDYISFQFEGTKLRLISSMSYYRSRNICISIDGIVERFNEGNSSSSPTYQILVYEKTNLESKVHNVKIYLDSNSLPMLKDNIAHAFELDAIDIDNTGKVLPYDYTTLTATASATSSAITLNWGKVDVATGYNVKRSITQGSGYTIIASNITENTYNDRNVEAGKTYYYIVTPIINGQEGTPSNEASATVNKPTETGNAILTITMTNGNVKSYTVSMTKVNDFISWYNNRSSGSNGSPYYAFDKTDNLQPFVKKTEYIIFDKISSFEVDEYSK